MGAFVTGLAAAVFLAWMPTAHTPRPPVALSTPSYDKMAAALTTLYPGSRDHAKTIVRVVHEEADRHRLDPCLVMGIIAKESSFRPHARSGRDVGLMQVNLDWHPELVSRAGGVDGMLDARRNVRAGTEIFARYRRLAADDRDALRRYNGLGKRNDYVQRVQAQARSLQSAGACLGDDDGRYAAG